MSVDTCTKRWDSTLSLSLGRTPLGEDGDAKSANKTHKTQKQHFRSVGGATGLTRRMNGVVKSRKHIVLLGLDGSGKTTILMRLKFRCQISTVPTIGFNHEKVWGGGFRWSAWDVGGGEKLRPLWVMYARATDGIVFVVDSSSNADLIEEARVELSKVIKASKLSSLTLNSLPPPVLVLSNFQDKLYARSPEEMAIVLGLSEQWASGVMWAVAPVCGLTGEGLDNALHTLRALIVGSKKEREKVDRRLQKMPRPRWLF